MYSNSELKITKNLIKKNYRLDNRNFTCSRKTQIYNLDLPYYEHAIKVKLCKTDLNIYFNEGENNENFFLLNFIFKDLKFKIDYQVLNDDGNFFKALVFGVYMVVSKNKNIENNFENNFENKNFENNLDINLDNVCESFAIFENNFENNFEHNFENNFEHNLKNIKIADPTKIEEKSADHNLFRFCVNENFFYFQSENGICEDEVVEIIKDTI